MLGVSLITRSTLRQGVISVSGVEHILDLFMAFGDLDGMEGGTGVMSPKNRPSSQESNPFLNTVQSLVSKLLPFQPYS